MSYILNYSSTPQATFTWSPTANISYVIVSWTGNTTATSTTNSSGTVYLPISTYTTADLSLNTKYTFTMTPYNSAGGAGNSKTFTCDTTPAIRYFYSSAYTYTYVNLYWLGLYNTVSITRKVGTLSATTIASAVSSTSYTDTDISGNTTYYYYLTPTFNSTTYSNSNTISFTTAVYPPYDLSINTYDSSSIKLSFSVGKNSYSSSCIYTAVATDSSGNSVTNTGTSSPILIQNLSGSTYYSCSVYITLDYSANLVSYNTGTNPSVTLNTSIASFTNIFTVASFS